MPICQIFFACRKKFSPSMHLFSDDTILKIASKKVGTFFLHSRKFSKLAFFYYFYTIFKYSELKCWFIELTLLLGSVAVWLPLPLSSKDVQNLKMHLWNITNYLARKFPQCVLVSLILSSYHGEQPTMKMMHNWKQSRLLW